MAFDATDPANKGKLFETSGAVQTLLGLPGLGNDTSLQLKDELAERQKKLLKGATDDKPAYGVGALLGSAVTSLFGDTK